MGKTIRATTNGKKLSGVIDKGKMARRTARKHAQEPRGTMIIPGKASDPCTCDRPQLRCPLHDDDFADYDLGLVE